jgi:hypothetical protein
MIKGFAGFRNASQSPFRDDMSVESFRIPCAFPYGETISIEKICTATESKPRMGFHMVNHLRRLAGVFRIDSMDMNALTGNVNSTADRVDRVNKFKKFNK